MNFAEDLNANNFIDDKKRQTGQVILKAHVTFGQMSWKLKKIPWDMNESMTYKKCTSVINYK